MGKGRGGGTMLISNKNLARSSKSIRHRAASLHQHLLIFCMTSSFRPALALLLGVSATLLTACDYKYSPGVNTQFKHGFSGTPGYTNADINRDSINYQQNVHTPIGKGSAQDLATGSVDDQLQSAPGGKSTTPQSASGKLDGVDKASPTNSSAAPSGKQQ